MESFSRRRVLRSVVLATTMFGSLSASLGAGALAHAAATGARQENGGWTVTLHDPLSGEGRMVRAPSPAPPAPGCPAASAAWRGSTSARRVRPVKRGHATVPKLWHGEHACPAQSKTGE